MNQPKQSANIFQSNGLTKTKKQEIQKQERKKRGWSSPIAIANIPEPDGLLRRKIHHDKTIDTNVLAILKQTLLAITHNRVKVAHKHNRRLQTLAPCLANKIKDRADGDTIGQGLGVGFLDGRAIGDGISEGNTQFDDI